MANEIVLRPSYWASVSGGKDSLYMLMLILANPDKYPLDGVIHFELEIDFPFIKNVVALMEEKVTALGIPFVKIKPRYSWVDLYNKYGFPSRHNRWCNKPYKMDAEKQLKEFLKTKNEYLVSYIGLCADETSRFRTGNVIYPLAENDIVESTILEWAKTEPIFNDYYKYNNRCGCMYCPLAGMQTLAYMCVFYPVEFERYFEMAITTEDKTGEKLGRKFSLFQMNTKYDARYYYNRVKTVYVPRLLEQIKANNPSS